ncbi:major facilitator superfamily domain-containing protein [Pyronema omphalodes]|nr:major facilitator superfamily domain-containing protein [Pyronema omphalodes]
MANVVPASTRHEPKFTANQVKQLFLCLCRVSEPLALTSIYPYMYFMIKSFGVQKQDIPYWSGVMVSSFSVAQMLLAVFWGRISDIWGRKFCIIISLTGVFIAMIIFGFANSLAMAMAARMLAGVVSGNVGTMRTMIAEIVPQSQLQVRANGFLPAVYYVSSIFGPIIGGYLSDPLTNHPEWFNGQYPPFLEKMLKKYPFSLPNIFLAIIFLLGITNGILFLDETKESLKNRPDPGRVIGRRIENYLYGPLQSLMSSDRFYIRFYRYLCGLYRDLKFKLFNSRETTINTTAEETAPLLSAGNEVVTAKPRDEECAHPVAVIADASHTDTRKPSVWSIFTFKSSLTLFYSCMLGFHTLTSDQLLSVFLSTPIDDGKDWAPPFKFHGGFGWDASDIGQLYSVNGFISMFFILVLNPILMKNFGNLNCLKIATLLYPRLHYHTILVVITIHFARTRAFAFSLIQSYVVSSLENKELLGTINGVNVTLAGGGRAIGPTMGGIIFGACQKAGYIVIFWVFVAIIAMINYIPVMYLWELTDKPKKEEHARASTTAVGYQTTGMNGTKGDTAVLFAASGSGSSTPTSQANNGDLIQFADGDVKTNSRV